MTIEGRKVTRNVIQNDSLERIASEVIGCPFCKLSRTRKNAGPGEGQGAEKRRRKRKNVFKKKVVKCRPPSNRIPDEDERITCRPYLQRQISLISPKII